MDGKWVCFILHPQFRRRNNSTQKALQKAFGKDFLDCKIVSCGETSEDCYVFAQCKNYFAHVSQLTHDSIIRTALPSTAAPNFLTDDEVSDFISSMSAPEPVRGQFTLGDVVLVTNGYLNNLTGIILAEERDCTYRVKFKFHIRQFDEIIHASELKYVGNVRDRLPISATA